MDFTYLETYTDQELQDRLVEIREELDFIRANSADFSPIEIPAITVPLGSEMRAIHREQTVREFQECLVEELDAAYDGFTRFEDDTVDVEAETVVDAPALPAAAEVVVEDDDVVDAPVADSWLDDFYLDIPEPQFEDDTPDAEWLDEEFEQLTTPRFTPVFTSFIHYLIWLINSIYDEIRTPISYLLSLGYSSAASS